MPTAGQTGKTAETQRIQATFTNVIKIDPIKQPKLRAVNTPCPSKHPVV